ncbi:hypothetical protein [Mesobacillus maritimus]|uniref:hypothetical protein n=1 Tax=Mesobacillus maritimus TaxID=1643336 RepID=UPI00384BB524
MGVEPVTTANSTMTIEFRTYRDGALLQTKVFNRSISGAGTQRFMVGNTYVDTAPATNPTSTYELRLIVTAATNITSVTAVNRDLNLIKF